MINLVRLGDEGRQKIITNGEHEGEFWPSAPCQEENSPSPLDECHPLFEFGPDHFEITYPASTRKITPVIEISEALSIYDVRISLSMPETYIEKGQKFIRQRFDVSYICAKGGESSVVLTLPEIQIAVQWRKACPFDDRELWEMQGLDEGNNCKLFDFYCVVLS
jgi:hypothetical protein